MLLTENQLFCGKGEIGVIFWQFFADLLFLNYSLSIFYKVNKKISKKIHFFFVHRMKILFIFAMSFTLQK